MASAAQAQAAQQAAHTKAPATTQAARDDQVDGEVSDLSTPTRHGMRASTTKRADTTRSKSSASKIPDTAPTEALGMDMRIAIV